jgi:hypothetical protein
VGLRDVLWGRHEVKGPAPDKLFAITTAWVTLESAHSISPAGKAAIVFQALANSEFEATVKEMEEVVKATGGESGTTVATEDDSYGYRWMVLRNPEGAPSVEDLAVGINAVATSIETAGYGERLLCAVFAFTDAKGPPVSGSPRSAGPAVYFIYNYKRGDWYPFVPKQGGEADGSASKERDTERELQIKAQVGTELPLEPEIERWFPLWGIPI